MAAKLKQEKCPCNVGTLTEITRTPPSLNSDAYEEEYRSIYFECDTCSTLYTGIYNSRGDNYREGPIVKYDGRLSKNELEKTAKQGYEGIHVKELEKIVDTYNKEKSAGTLTSQMEIDLLKEAGYTDSMIDNLTKGLTTPNYFHNKQYSSVFEYFLNEHLPLEKSFLKSKTQARKNMNRMLGADIY